jgi:LPXTG-motif cell wall-anchored protein
MITVYRVKIEMSAFSIRPITAWFCLIFSLLAQDLSAHTSVVPHVHTTQESGDSSMLVVGLGLLAVSICAAGYFYFRRKQNNR